MGYKKQLIFPSGPMYTHNINIVPDFIDMGKP